MSGKGGTGKSAVGVGLARALARRGKRVLIVEIDAPRANLPIYFGKAITATPTPLAPRIEGCNIDFFAALTAYVQSVVPVKAIVGLILRNSVVRIFLTATPGARELVLLSRIWEFSLDPRWDHVIVDLPASGHTLALMRCPFLARRTFARGPLRNRADQIVERFVDPDVAALYFCALPGEMPINETIETRAMLVELGMPTVGGAFLNRYPDESWTPEERAMLEELAAEARGGFASPAVVAAAEAALETRQNQELAEEGLERLLGVFGAGHVGRLPVLPGTPSQVADAVSLIIAEWL